jgi:GST-like protein
VIRLHTAATPNGRKVSIALEELGLAYETRAWDIGSDEQKSDEFLALNPNHKIPVLEDDGIVVWESGAILLHLAEKYGKLLPPDPARRIEAIQYAFFQTGGLGPNLGRLGAQLRRPEAERNGEMVEIFLGEVSRLVGVLERILADGRPYLAGDFSIGDIMHYPWMKPMLALKAPPLMERRAVVEWLERIEERPAVQRGMAVPA